MDTTPLGLYLHIPFCRHRCSYCDFNTYTSLGDLQAAYARSLSQEIAFVARAPGSQAGTHRVETIFFGGGTPSLMTPGQLAEILAAVRRHFLVAAGAEITMEANPETVDRDYLTAVRALGVNRLSFGAQSAVAAELALLGRDHDFATVARAMTAARDAGFERLSLDLIYGVPGQTLRSWRTSLKAALELDPGHLSLYCLTIEPGTPLKRWLDQGQLDAADPDLAADQYELAGAMLAGAGYEQYEISNWSRPGEACRHNLVYWRSGEFLGLGAGAHGYAAGVRYHVVRQPRVYIRRLASGHDNRAPSWPLTPAVAGHRREEAAEAMSMAVIMQLRLLQEGLDQRDFAHRFGQSLQAVYGEAVDQLLDWGLLRQAGDRLFLSDRGRFLSNQVFVRFV